MAILVTGGAGYIGSHVVYALTDQGRDVVVIDNLSTGAAECLPRSIPLVVGDIGDRELLAYLIKQHNVDAVIHLAASTDVGESVSEPLSYYENNTVKSQTLIAAACAAGVRKFVFSSTAAVYGNPTAVPVTEDSGLQPISPYGTSKLMTEIMLRDVAAVSTLNVAILRYFNVAGADPSLRSGQSARKATHLVRRAVQAALGSLPLLEVYGNDFETKDGTGVRDYIHVSDLADLHLRMLGLLENHRRDFLVLNCGYGRGYSVLEIIESVRRVTGRKLEIKAVDRRPGDPATIVADTSKLRATVDWVPRYDDIDEMVRHAFAWEQKLGKK